MKAVKMIKACALFAIAGTATLFTTGCASPGYSAGDNVARISRNMDYDLGQAVDDWDHFWMLRSASSLTIWDVQTEY